MQRSRGKLNKQQQNIASQIFSDTTAEREGALKIRGILTGFIRFLDLVWFLLLNFEITS